MIDPCLTHHHQCLQMPFDYIASGTLNTLRASLAIIGGVQGPAADRRFAQGWIRATQDAIRLKHGDDRISASSCVSTSSPYLGRWNAGRSQRTWPDASSATRSSCSATSKTIF